MQSRLNGRTFNVALALFAAVSLAFFIVAMPADPFGWLVDVSGLPELIAAAQPPLGMTSQLIVAAAAGAIAFLLICYLLRALDDPPAAAEGVQNDDPVDFDWDSGWNARRLRRADSHPDAPVRRPVFAGQELGDPMAADLAALPDDAVSGDASKDPLMDSPVAQLPVPEPGAAATASSLIERLDQGVKSTEWPLASAPSDEPQAQVEDRLRSVLDDLQKLAAHS